MGAVRFRAAALYTANIIFDQWFVKCSEGFSSSFQWKCFFFSALFLFRLFYLVLQSASAFFLWNSPSNLQHYWPHSLSVSHLNHFSSHITPFPYISFTCCYTPDPKEAVIADSLFLTSPYTSIIHSGTLSPLLPELQSLFFLFSPLHLSAHYSLLIRFVGWALLKMFSFAFDNIQVNLSHLAALHKASNEVQVLHSCIF